ncbi:hypothetical protein [Inconstantimicrobium mannanitabidum]|uniref:Uncharacterized protein n=1 Tax=Inconstantimicrobium mannanitabidum TaxID=1604901 RepID=A0ACB5RB60_9CLOT|nr:hypothetical protein [Clostridium sp. TW13]GKX66450.1 hypothetical protein rsdtw13_17080 [Clostridium sp. TW13]
MKNNKIIIIFIIIFSTLIVGCTKEMKNSENKIINSGNKIIVEKRTGTKNNYEYYSEIKDSKKVQDIKDILESVSWKNAQVNMAYPPLYKFHFAKDNNEASDINYEVWVSPNKDKVELVIDNKAKYIQLDEKKSAKLFETLTGKKLGEL